MAATDKKTKDIPYQDDILSKALGDRKTKVTPTLLLLTITLLLFLLFFLYLPALNRGLTSMNSYHGCNMAAPVVSNNHWGYKQTANPTTMLIPSLCPHPAPHPLMYPSICPPPYPPYCSPTNALLQKRPATGPTGPQQRAQREAQAKKAKADIQQCPPLPPPPKAQAKERIALPLVAPS